MIDKHNSAFACKAVIFDLDGTLIDSMQLWRRVDRDFLHKRGITVPKDLFAHLPAGNSFIQTAQYFIDRFALPDSVESVMREWTDMVGWHYGNDVKLKPGAARLLHHLSQRGTAIGLGTSNSYELAHKVLSRNGIWELFRSVVTGDMHLLGKPFPDIYLKSAENLGLDPKDCVVVEDTLTGVQAGKAAGMKVIAIFDEDSLEHHDRMRELADAFAQNHHEIRDML
jgi:HAD superfamily hydrolase (TIGR01509 family)